jgi:hypothetical protein
MKLIQSLAVTLLTMTSAHAFADCTIVLSLCKPLGIHSSTSFADNYQGADRNPRRCLLRAREYLNSCRSNQMVGAEFSIKGQLTVSTYVTPTQSSIWTKDTAGSWIQIPGKY